MKTKKKFFLENIVRTYGRKKKLEIDKIADLKRVEFDQKPDQKKKKI